MSRDVTRRVTHACTPHARALVTETDIVQNDDTQSGHVIVTEMRLEMRKKLNKQTKK